MSLSPFIFAGAHAVVTGAASGIGEQLAVQLADAGTHLVLIDRDQAGLEKVTARVKAGHPQLDVHALVADLADLDAIDDLIARIVEVSPKVNLLINNAGVAIGGAFTDLSAEEFDWVQAINFRAPVALCRGLLPTLLDSPGSHIVNVSSLFGLIGPAGQSAYSSSKFALRGFSEVLRHELAHLGMGVTCVHPGGIATRISENARIASAIPVAEAEQGKKTFGNLLTYPADKAAGKILAGVHQRKGRVLIAISAVVPDLIVRLFPARYEKVMARLSPSTARKAAASREAAVARQMARQADRKQGSRR